MANSPNRTNTKKVVCMDHDSIPTWDPRTQLFFWQVYY
jgi:hypothetical protein